MCSNPSPQRIRSELMEKKGGGKEESRENKKAKNVTMRATKPTTIRTRRPYLKTRRKEKWEKRFYSNNSTRNRIRTNNQNLVQVCNNRVK